MDMKYRMTYKTMDEAGRYTGGLKSFETGSLREFEDMVRIAEKKNFRIFEKRVIREA